MESGSAEDWEVVLVGDKCANNRRIRATVKELPCEVSFSEDGLDRLPPHRNLKTTVFVYDQFGDSIFHTILKKGAKIVGPPQLEVFAKDDVLPTRPQYCQSMKDVVACVSGFTVKEEKAEITELIRYMGGSVRREASAKVTHSVVASARCPKYQPSVMYDCVIVLPDWVKALWEKRDDTSVTSADSTILAQYKLKPFDSCRLAFVGFKSAEEVQEMEDKARAYGGSVVALGDDTVTPTHLVIEKEGVEDMERLFQMNAWCVKPDWFWASIAIEARSDESIYAHEEQNDANSPASLLQRKHPIKKAFGIGLARKRRRTLRVNLAQLAEEGGGMMNTSRMSADGGLESTPGGASNASFLSDMFSPDDSLANKSTEILFGRPSKRLSALSGGDGGVMPIPLPQLGAPSFVSGDTRRASTSVTPAAISAAASKSDDEGKAAKRRAARQRVMMELCHTEKNYCGILRLILSFRGGNEGELEKGAASMLSPTHMKLIFGDIPSILDVHQSMADDLEAAAGCLDDPALVGPIFTSKAKELECSYPKFVNFYEQIKETIQNCEKSNDRFHAFLKVCERKPESGRQTLVELLINIVQRIPRIELLLAEIKKYTEPAFPDYGYLDEARSALKGVMTHINEGKRKTEGQMALFELVKEIEGCPPSVISSTRMFIFKVDVEDIAHRNEKLALFVFNDALEIAKWKTRAYGTLKSPKPGTTGGKPMYKHSKLIHLKDVKRVVEINDADTLDFQMTFALMCCGVDDPLGELLTFNLIPGQALSKKEFLSQLAKLIGTCCYRTNFENILHSCSAEELGIESHSNSFLSKRISFAVKKVKRASTHAKGTSGRLRRMMSSVMSLTPSRQSQANMAGNFRRARANVSPSPSTTTLDPSMMSHMGMSSMMSGSSLMTQSEIGGSVEELNLTAMKGGYEDMPISDFSTVAPLLSYSSRMDNSQSGLTNTATSEALISVRDCSVIMGTPTTGKNRSAVVKVGHSGGSSSGGGDVGGSSYGTGFRRSEPCPMMDIEEEKRFSTPPDRAVLDSPPSTFTIPRRPPRSDKSILRSQTMGRRPRTDSYKESLNRSGGDERIMPASWTVPGGEMETAGMTTPVVPRRSKAVRIKTPGGGGPNYSPVTPMVPEEDIIDL